MCLRVSKLWAIKIAAFKNVILIFQSWKRWFAVCCWLQQLLGSCQVRPAGSSGYLDPARCGRFKTKKSSEFLECCKKIQHARHKNYHQQCLSWQKISNINFSVKKNIKQNFFCEFKCIILSTNTAWHTNNNFNNVCQCLPVGFYKCPK